MLGVAITRSLALVADKAMAAREQLRVGSVAAIAVARIAERLEQGHPARPDFFSSDGLVQSDGERLLEGVLLKARDEYEEKKLRYLGIFYGNLTFSEVSASVASLLIKTFERLTYRQLIILALIRRSGVLNVKNLRGQSHADPDLEALKREEMDLHGNDFGTSGLIEGAGYDDELSALGVVLVELAEIGHIPEIETDGVVTLLGRCPERK